MKNKMGNWNFLRDQSYVAYENPEFKKALTQLIDQEKVGTEIFETLQKQFLNSGDTKKLAGLMEAADEATKS
ncbi:MAG: hypothetical protein IH819_12455 [Bacteroidetes bacterium]|nr:hypothetical protein [Bacteroidota bacterium]